MPGIHVSLVPHVGASQRLQSILAKGKGDFWKGANANERMWV